MAGSASRRMLGILGVGILGVGTLGLVGLPGTAAAEVLAGDADSGRLLARRWCAGCHVVEAGVYTQGTGEAPPFPALASDARWTAERLRAFLMVPHPPMPPVNLSSYDIDDLVAHIQSLKKPRSGSAEGQNLLTQVVKHRRKRRGPKFRFAGDDGGSAHQILQGRLATAADPAKLGP